MDRKAARAVRNDLHKTIKNVFSDTFLASEDGEYIIFYNTKRNCIIQGAHLMSWYVGFFFIDSDTRTRYSKKKKKKKVFP